MATRPDIRQRIREQLGAFPYVTTVNEALDTTETVITLTSATGVAPRSILEIDSELVTVASISSLDITVNSRGDRGTTAATHSNLATCYTHPYWGWTNIELNSIINHAIRWLKPKVWVPKFWTGTFASGSNEYSLTGITEGVASYPNYGKVKWVKYRPDSSTDYKVYRNWVQMEDRLILGTRLGSSTQFQLLIEDYVQDITDETTSLAPADTEEAIVLFSIARALQTLLANRVRFVEYSATLNDRASTADELTRTIYYFYNQANLRKDELSRAGGPVYLSNFHGAY